jgi:hypothetical protein
VVRKRFRALNLVGVLVLIAHCKKNSGESCAPKSPTVSAWCEKNGGPKGCPQTAAAALVQFRQACEQFSELNSILRSEGCGRIEIALESGTHGGRYVYDARSGALVGADWGNDFPCSYDRAGVLDCPSKQTCVVCGKHSDKIALITEKPALPKCSE